VHSLLRLQTFLIVVVLSIGTRLSATDAWDSPAFTTDPAILRQAAQAVQAGKHSEATVLLNELHFKFDENGKMLETRHLIYRIENQDGVKDWAETSGRWEAWHQDKPEIKACVITAEGAVHWLDPKTLNDFPMHEDPPDVYSDGCRPVLKHSSKLLAIPSISAPRSASSACSTPGIRSLNITRTRIVWCPLADCHSIAPTGSNHATPSSFPSRCSAASFAASLSPPSKFGPLHPSRRHL
jgi:hypothetical protein